MKKLLISSSLLLVMCASSNYPHYGVDLSKMSIENARAIRFLAARDSDRDLTGVDCWTPSGAAPRCIMIESDVHLALQTKIAQLQKRLEHCEGSSR